MENDRVCRTCFHIFGVNSVSSLNQTEDDCDSVSLRQKLKACVPELTLDIVDDPVICETCKASIILAYQFKSLCLDNEKNLYKFIQQRKDNPYDLLTNSDLLKIVRKDISEEHSYSCVTTYYSNGHITEGDNDSDSELSPLKLPATVHTSLEAIVKQALTEKSSCKSLVNNEEAKETLKTSSKAEERSKQSKRLVAKGNQSTFNASEDKGDISETAKSPSTPLKLSKKQKKATENISSPKTPSNLKTVASSEVSASTEPPKTTLNSKISKAPKTADSSVNKEDNCTEVTGKSHIKQLQSEGGFSDSALTSNLSVKQSVENAVDRLQIDIPENAAVSESACETLLKTRERRCKRRKQQVPKKNPGNSTNNGCDSSAAKHPKVSNILLPKKTKLKECTYADMEKNKLETIEKLSVTNNEETVEPRKKILEKLSKSDTNISSNKTPKRVCMKNETLDDDKLYQSEIPPSSKIKKSYSSQDIPLTYEDSIENDLLQINQMISKNNFSESRKVSRYRSNNKRYRCTKCDKAYSFKSHFDVHLKSHIFKKLYTCPICEKDFAQEKYLKSHAMLHTSTGLYQCDICLKYLSASTALKRHYSTHSGEKPYPCACCNKRFAQKIQLTVHMRTHTGYRPYTCNVCRADFTQKSHLMGHMRIHTGEKPFKCDQCPKSFRKGYALQIHKHSHSVKPFQCKACNFLFKDHDVFQRHISKHLMSIATTGSHVLKKPKCRRKILDELEQDVKDINMANYLKEQFSGDELEIKPKEPKVCSFYCDVCKRGFTTKFSMRRHISSHANDSLLPCAS